MADEFFADSAPTTWEAMTLGEVVRRGGGQVQTGPFGSQLHASDYVQVGVPFIMPVNIGENRIIEEGIARVTEEDAKRLSRHRIKAGDIIYSRRGDVERRALVRADQEGWMCGSGCLMVRVGEGVADPVFTSYYLGHPAIREWIVRHAVGATMPNLNTSIMAALPFCLPSLPEQRAIAHILGTLDDKIELNRRMNATLEEMARALFKSWFVDFDPVRAKAEGRDPGLPREIADLFPDGFEESELGNVPTGWRILPLPEAIEVNPTRSLAGIKIAPYLDMASMPTRGHRPDRWIERPVGSGMKFVNGDTLLARITPCLENGKTAFVDFLKNGQVGWGSTEYIVLRPKHPLPPSFGYYLARTEELRTFAIQNMTGSSGRQRVPAECLKQFLLVVPSESVAKRFGEVVQGFMERTRINSEQSRTLAALRDTLLPKLISGEVRVHNLRPSEEGLQ